MIYSHPDTLSLKYQLICIRREEYKKDNHSLCENISIHFQQQRLNMEQKQQCHISPVGLTQPLEVEAKFIFNEGV